MAIAAVLAASMSLVACGGDDTESADTAKAAAAPAAAKLTGEPIVTYTISAVNTQGPQYKNVQEAARVYGEWVNANGGIKGRPLEVKLCDTKGTPTDAVACMRKAVADKAVSVVGSFDYAGDAMLPVLEKAGIAYFGLCCPISAAENTSKISFPIGNGPLFATGLVKRAKDDGCQRTSFVIQEGAETFIPPMQSAAKKLGLDIGKPISLPAEAQDYSPQVAKATSNDADCILTVISETSFVAFMGPFKQSGSKARKYGPMGNLNEVVAKGNEEATNGDVNSGMADQSLPVWKDYTAALETYDADPKQDYNSLGGLGTWAGYEAFRQVVESIDGPITSETFLKAAQTAKIDTGGMYPKLDMTKTWDKGGGPKGYDRLVNRCVIFSTLKDGKQVALTDKYEDVSQLAGGTQPSDCD